MRTAVLFATDSAGVQSSPLMQSVGGMPLLLRQLRVLRSLEVDEITVLACGALIPALERALRGRLGVSGVHLLEAPADGAAGGLGQALTAQLAGTDQPTLLWRGEWVFERQAVARLIDAYTDESGLIACDEEDAAYAPTGLLVASPQHAGDLARWLCSWPAVDPPAELPDQLTPLALAPQQLVGRVTDAASARLAEDALWEGCRKPIDGIVSRHINRHLSLAVSRRIVGSPIHPNHVSLFNILLGLAAAGLATRATYTSMLVGALLLQLNSVLDGVDGELARIRLQFSVLGEWLDTIGDDLSNQAFFAAIAWAAYRSTGHAGWLALGAAAVLPSMATSAYYYRWCYLQGRGDVLAFDWFRPKEFTDEQRAARSLFDRLVDLFTQIFRRDSFVLLLLIAAALGILPLTLFIIAPAALVTLGALLARHRTLARKMTRQSP